MTQNYESTWSTVPEDILREIVGSLPASLPEKDKQFLRDLFKFRNEFGAWTRDMLGLRAETKELNRQYPQYHPDLTSLVTTAAMLLVLRQQTSDSDMYVKMQLRKRFLKTIESLTKTCNLTLKKNNPA